MPPTSKPKSPKSPPPAIGHDVPPDVLAQIEARAGASVSDVPPELVKFAVEKSKRAGNDAMRRGAHREAIAMYTQAIAGDATDATLRSNRSAAFLAIGDVEAAIEDAARCVQMDDAWAKAHYRLGCALTAYGEYALAERSFEAARKIAPGDAAVRERLAAASELAADERERAEAQVYATRRDLARRLKDARNADRKEMMETGWKQQMQGPDWDASDYEWRPTFLPLMRARKLDAKKFLSDRRRAGMLRFAAAVAELDAIKRTLPTLDDAPRLAAYARAVKRACPDKRIVSVANGACGVLPMMAASAGATRVIVVERNRFCYRAAKQCVRSNRERLGDAFDRITLLDQKLETCRLKGDDAPLELDETAGDDAGALPPPPLATIDAPADVFLTDLFDHNAGLGLGVLRAIDHARDRGLVTPDAVCVPGSITVNAALLSLRMETVSGFDVSSLNAYRWHPQAARLLELAREPHLLLSDVFEVTRVDLTRRLREKEKDKEDDEEEEEEGKKKKNSGGGKAAWEDDFEVRVPVVADGAFNAVAFWFECDLGGGEVLRSVAPPWGGTGTGTVEGGGDDQEPAATKKRSDDTRYFDADSFGVAVQYLDETFVDASETISLRVRRDKDQVFFTSTPPPTRPRHAHIPQWHYDMLHDAGRNEAYDAAIKTAVTATKRRLGGRCEVLDCGSGSGLLSMMAARAGATHVTAAERDGHMTDAGEENVCVNGFAGVITCVNRDTRYMFTSQSPGLEPKFGLKPDGAKPEMERLADLMVFEVFDSGLIGEGVLHALAFARHRLLTTDAALVPARATIFCQPIEMRFGELSVELNVGDGEGNDASDATTFSSDTMSTTTMTYDMSQANRWRWRKDYEGINLERERHAKRWTPLAPPAEAFSFDFKAVTAETLRPEAMDVTFQIDRPGVFNAIAFWFELHLNDDVRVSTSPHDGTKGQTWQQAVQHLEEVEVTPGDAVPLIATHDTYGVAFEVNDAKFPDRATRRTGVPLYDPTWAVAHEGIKKITDDIARAIVQSPIEYRAAAEAAVAAGARPGDLGLETDVGAEYCLRMMA